MKNFWENFGKVSAVLGTVAVIIGIYFQVKSDKRNIDFEGSVTTISLPTNIIDTSFANRVDEAYDYNDSLRKYYDRDYLKKLIKRKYYLWKFIVTNNEDVEIKNLKISLPWTGFFKVIDSENSVDSNLNKVIFLPTLKPDGSAEIWVWVENYQSADFMYRDRIILIDELGSYKIADTYILNGVYAWLYKNLGIILFFSGILLYALITLKDYLKFKKMVKEDEKEK